MYWLVGQIGNMILERGKNRAEIKATQLPLISKCSALFPHDPWNIAMKTLKNLFLNHLTLDQRIDLNPFVKKH